MFSIEPPPIDEAPELPPIEDVLWTQIKWLESRIDLLESQNRRLRKDNARAADVLGTSDCGF